ncbi:MAG: RidA family protein [Dehalococcoidia bacterium]|nr:RidA family protein [Dehalococcoidia bacterium]
MTRQRISSGGPWEERIGYSRAVRVGDRVSVSGTTGTRNDGSVPETPVAQARLALETIAAALEEAGASLDEVVRARFFVTDVAEWDAMVPAVRECFGHARPAMTMVQVSALIDPRQRVEIEVEAVIGSA